MHEANEVVHAESEQEAPDYNTQQDPTLRSNENMNHLASTMVPISFTCHRVLQSRERLFQDRHSQSSPPFPSS